MSLRNDHYLRLAYNSRRSTADDRNNHEAGLAGVLVATAMLTLLVVTVDRPAFSSPRPLLPVASASLHDTAK